MVNQLALPRGQQRFGAGLIGADRLQCRPWRDERCVDVQLSRGMIAILTKFFDALDDFGGWPGPGAAQPDRPVFLRQLHASFRRFAKRAAPAI